MDEDDDFDVDVDALVEQHRQQQQQAMAPALKPANEGSTHSTGWHQSQWGQGQLQSHPAQQSAILGNWNSKPQPASSWEPAAVACAHPNTSNLYGEQTGFPTPSFPAPATRGCYGTVLQPRITGFQTLQTDGSNPADHQYTNTKSISQQPMSLQSSRQGALPNHTYAQQASTSGYNGVISCQEAVKTRNNSTAVNAAGGVLQDCTNSGFVTATQMLSHDSQPAGHSSGSFEYNKRGWNAPVQQPLQQEQRPQQSNANHRMLANHAPLSNHPHGATCDTQAMHMLQPNISRNKQQPYGLQGPNHAMVQQRGLDPGNGNNHLAVQKPMPPLQLAGEQPDLAATPLGYEASAMDIPAGFTPNTADLLYDNAPIPSPQYDNMEVNDRQLPYPADQQHNLYERPTTNNQAMNTSHTGLPQAVLPQPRLLSTAPVSRWQYANNSTILHETTKVTTEKAGQLNTGIVNLNDNSVKPVTRHALDTTSAGWQVQQAGNMDGDIENEYEVTQSGRAFLDGVRHVTDSDEAKGILLGVEIEKEQTAGTGQAHSNTQLSLFHSPEVLNMLMNHKGHQLHPIHIRHWIYPCHKEVREYQFRMVKAALFSNALVCLPTGLGKTLIAAVVMGNHYRWFPEGKVVFIAPTRPLVTQQRQACRSVMGVAEEEAIELTANMKGNRQEMWAKHRLFFCTPELLKNDLATGKCPEKSIVCLVIDECHRAVGDAPAAKAVQQLRQNKMNFRLLGLSATPGSNYDAIQEVVNKLGISSIEYRSEKDNDVKPYCHEREVEVIGVGASDRAERCAALVANQLQDILRKLTQARACSPFPVGEVALRTKIMAAQQHFQQQTGQKGGSANVDKAMLPKIHTWFKQALCLSGIREALASEGAAVAADAFKTMAQVQPEVRELLKTAPGNLLNSTLQSLAAYPHPKMQRLEEELLAHFKEAENIKDGSLARAIVFTTLRSSVAGIVECLSKHAPLITARGFVGQGNRSKSSREEGMNQAEQKEVLAAFRQGRVNLLVATCIGEEGLDIPEVDLIICYDASASPTRQNQRMGRTARHRAGRVVYILQEPEEVAKYHSSQEEYRKLQGYLRNAPRYFKMAQSKSLLPQGLPQPRPVLIDMKAAGVDLPDDNANGKASAKKRAKKAADNGTVAQEDAAAKPAKKQPRKKNPPTKDTTTPSATPIVQTNNNAEVDDANVEDIPLIQRLSGSKASRSGKSTPKASGSSATSIKPHSGAGSVKSSHASRGSNAGAAEVQGIEMQQLGHGDASSQQLETVPLATRIAVRMSGKVASRKEAPLGTAYESNSASAAADVTWKPHDTNGIQVLGADAVMADSTNYVGPTSAGLQNWNSNSHETAAPAQGFRAPVSGFPLQDHVAASIQTSMPQPAIKGLQHTNSWGFQQQQQQPLQHGLQQSRQVQGTGSTTAQDSTVTSSCAVPPPASTLAAPRPASLLPRTSPNSGSACGNAFKMPRICFPAPPPEPKPLRPSSLDRVQQLKTAMVTVPAASAGNPAAALQVPHQSAEEPPSMHADVQANIWQQAQPNDIKYPNVIGPGRTGTSAVQDMHGAGNAYPMCNGRHGLAGVTVNYPRNDVFPPGCHEQHVAGEQLPALQHAARCEDHKTPSGFMPAAGLPDSDVYHGMQQQRRNMHMQEAAVAYSDMHLCQGGDQMQGIEATPLGYTTGNAEVDVDAAFSPPMTQDDLLLSTRRKMVAGTIVQKPRSLITKAMANQATQRAKNRIKPKQLTATKARNSGSASQAMMVVDPDNLPLTLDEVPLAARTSGGGRCSGGGNRSSGCAAPARPRKLLNRKRTPKPKPTVKGAGVTTTPGQSVVETPGETVPAGTEARSRQPNSDVSIGSMIPVTGDFNTVPTSTEPEKLEGDDVDVEDVPLSARMGIKRNSNTSVSIQFPPLHTNHAVQRVQHAIEQQVPGCNACKQAEQGNTDRLRSCQYQLQHTCGRGHGNHNMQLQDPSLLHATTHWQSQQGFPGFDISHQPPHPQQSHSRNTLPGFEEHNHYQQHGIPTWQSGAMVRPELHCMHRNADNANLEQTASFTNPNLHTSALHPWDHHQQQQQQHDTAYAEAGMHLQQRYASSGGFFAEDHTANDVHTRHANAVLQYGHVSKLQDHDALVASWPACMDARQNATHQLAPGHLQHHTSNNNVHAVQREPQTGDMLPSGFHARPNLQQACQMLQTPAADQYCASQQPTNARETTSCLDECVPETVLKSMAATSMPATRCKPAQERVAVSNNAHTNSALHNGMQTSMQHSNAAAPCNSTHFIEQTTHQKHVVPNITLYPPSTEPSPLAPRQLQFSARHGDDHTQTPSMYTNIHEAQHWQANPNHQYHQHHQQQQRQQQQQQHDCIPHMQQHDQRPVCPDITVHPEMSKPFGISQQQEPDSLLRSCGAQHSHRNVPMVSEQRLRQNSPQLQSASQSPVARQLKASHDGNTKLVGQDKPLCSRDLQGRTEQQQSPHIDDGDDDVTVYEQTEKPNATIGKSTISPSMEKNVRPVQPQAQDNRPLAGHCMSPEVICLTDTPIQRDTSPLVAIRPRRAGKVILDTPEEPLNEAPCARKIARVLLDTPEQPSQQPQEALPKDVAGALPSAAQYNGVKPTTTSTAAGQGSEAGNANKQQQAGVQLPGTFKVPGESSITPATRQKLAGRKRNFRTVEDDGDDNVGADSGVVKSNPSHAGIVVEHRRQVVGNSRETGMAGLLTSPPVAASQWNTQQLLQTPADQPAQKQLSRLVRGRPAAVIRGQVGKQDKVKRQAKGEQKRSRQDKETNKKKKKRRGAFLIDDEADVSSNGSGDEHSDDWDDEEMRAFIHDGTPSTAGRDCPGMAMYLGCHLTQMPESASKIDIANVVNKAFRRGRPMRKDRRAAGLMTQLPVGLMQREDDDDDERMPHERGIDIGCTQQMTGATAYDDGVCRECGEDGDVMFCDGCEAAYHCECAGLKAMPVAAWYCHHCLEGSQQLDLATGSAATTPGSVAEATPDWRQGIGPMRRFAADGKQSALDILAARHRAG